MKEKQKVIYDGLKQMGIARIEAGCNLGMKLTRTHEKTMEKKDSDEFQAIRHSQKRGNNRTKC